MASAFSACMLPLHPNCMGSSTGMAHTSKLLKHKQQGQTLIPLLTANNPAVAVAAEEEVMAIKGKELTQVKEMDDENIRLDVEANWKNEPDVADFHANGKATCSDVHNSQHPVASTTVDDNFLHSTSAKQNPMACSTVPKGSRSKKACKEAAHPTREWSAQNKFCYMKHAGFQPWMQRAVEAEKFEALYLLARVAEDAQAASIFTHGSIPFTQKKSTGRSMRVSNTNAASVPSHSNLVAEASSSYHDESSTSNQSLTSQTKTGKLDIGSSKNIPAGPLFQSKRRKRVTLPQRLGDFVIQLPKKRQERRTSPTICDTGS
ncbi:hypothetical protein O6H91_05G052900 [Diphasiastrum complanatum]|uniref:Uncharacterized protein n=1 Tax=Diphasiastrum complanatum TaxID=34168 RepID=A0ACC2DNI9_DIPCM|nr:hypothetical protein O6H91_05G052900 [Diphasiastrum complanatum]